MWLSSEPSSRWTVSSHKNWGENASNKSILQVLNQNMAAYEKGFWKSIIVPQINGGESVPVWWESLSNKMNIFLQCDFDHPLIQNFYQKVDEGYNYCYWRSKIQRMVWNEEATYSWRTLFASFCLYFNI